LSAGDAEGAGSQELANLARGRISKQVVQRFAA